MHFYIGAWEPIGSRGSLSGALSSITGINQEVLLKWGMIPGKQGLAQLRTPCYRDCSVAQRMSWASRPETTKVEDIAEDIAHCLLGLFDINMPLLYGEGPRAFARFQEEIMKVSTDQSHFAWGYDHWHTALNNREAKSTLAPDPGCFRDCGTIVEAFDQRDLSEFKLTNVGLTLTLPLVRTCDRNIVYAAPNYKRQSDPKARLCVVLATAKPTSAPARMEPTSGQSNRELSLGGS
ncbi:HET domain-containing protein [Colletotrichum sojae]|uniref:HET domain-containing protein n=1 Tax=Colletotrichum sojae TaxID=2175907 RepID=A0A8H6ISE2_9PEZI|nr:HET domain-containing protein [Colletotrichum sojae]